jgi:hypothetical protein
MANDVKRENSGLDVARVFFIHNGRVSVGDTHVPLASPQIELGSIHQRRVVCLTMTDEDAKTFQEAWQRIVHSMSQASGKYLVSDFNPLATPDERYATDVRYVSRVSYCDVSHASVTYAELRSGGATRLDAEYAGVTYAEASHHEVVYSSARGKRLIEKERLEGEVLIPLTIRGDSRQTNRRIIMQIDGIDDVQVRPSLAGPDLVDVLLQLATTLSIEKLIWLIESE